MRLYRLKYLLFGGLILVSIISQALAQSNKWAANKLPELGEISTENLSDDDARRISHAVYITLRRNKELLDDTEVNSYLNEIGAKLVRASEAERYNLQFYAILDPTINAFTVPGGFVGVNIGLLAAAQYESELAAVLAHEIAHITQHHAARIYFTQKRTTPWVLISTIALSILAAAAQRGDAAAAALAGGQGLMIQNQLSFTQRLEEEADHIGMQILKKSGFDPSAMVGFFGRLLQKERYHINVAPAFLRSHPVTSKRISDSQARLQSYGYKQVESSANFLFIREKIKILQLNNAAALSEYRKALIEKRYASLAAQYYGLALVEYRNNHFDKALGYVKNAQQILKKDNAMLKNLEALILVQKQKIEEALHLFWTSFTHHPTNRSLMYNALETLIKIGRYKEVIHHTSRLLLIYPTDPELYQYAAKSYAALGDTQQQYQMQSEYYAYHLEYNRAVDMLEQALAQKGGDFYRLSAIEARLKQLQQLAQLYQ